ncbi:MAG: rod-binding protein [Tabrizicola sp.]
MDIPPISATAPAREALLMTKAKELEATFLSEMLGHSGLGALDGAFGGGPGEAQFASFLRQEQAKLIVRGGGLGLAELIFKAMTEAENGTA